MKARRGLSALTLACVVVAGCSSAPGPRDTSGG